MEYNITTIIQAVFALIAAVITVIVIPYIKSKTTAQQQAEGDPKRAKQAEQQSHGFVGLIIKGKYRKNDRRQQTVTHLPAPIVSHGFSSLVPLPRIGHLTHLADLPQAILVDQLDLTTIERDDPLGDEGRQRPDRVGCRHVRQVRQILTCQINTQGRAILLEAIAVLQEQQRLRQAAADVFLRQVDRPLIGDTQVDGQLTDKEHRQVRITLDQVAYDRHRDHTNGRRLESGRVCQVILLGETRPITEILDRLDHPDDLATAAHAILEYFHLAL